MTLSEFTVKQQWQSDRRSPARWIFSHTWRHWWIILAMLIGALGNALLAAISPLQTGRAFDAIIATPPDLKTLGNAALIIALIELGRGLILQLARNIAAETLGQRLERDIRAELYANLIGKSMGFHDAHPTGDLMARATNDVREINFMFNPGLNKEGTIIEEGSHESLLARGGHYAELYNTYFRHQSPDYRPPALDEDDGYLMLLPRRRGGSPATA